MFCADKNESTVILACFAIAVIFEINPIFVTSK